MKTLHAHLRESTAGSALPQLERAQDEDAETVDVGGEAPEPEQEPELAPGTCSHCRGTGTRDDAPCTKCDGSGADPAVERITEAATRESLTAVLREAAVKKLDAGDDATPPRYEVTIIAEGFGNANDRRYYTKAALREAVSAGIFDGLQAYANHPSKSEERDRPERDVRQLVGHYEKARFVESGGFGEVRAEFVPIAGEDYGWVVDLIESSLRAQESTSKPLVGISIDGDGLVEPATLPDGSAGYYVKKLLEALSADMVTRAGAGGGFVSRLTESLHGLGASRPGPDPKEDTSMKPDELLNKVQAATAKLREAQAALRKDDISVDETATALKDLETATGELETLGGTEVEAQVREVEVPAPSGDADLDELRTNLREAEAARDAAIAERDAEKDRANGLQEKVTTYDRANDAAAVLREAEVPRDDAKRWFPDLLKCEGRDEMKRLIESRKAEVDAIAVRVRESIFGEGRVEGNPGARPAAAAGSRSLAEDVGVPADELTPAEEAAAA